MTPKLSILLGAAWVLGAAPATAAKPAAPAPRDTVREGGSLLRDLQTEDDAFYMDEILYFDPAFRDSAVSRLDSLGYTAFEKEQNKRPRTFHLEFAFAEHLADFNRVEGLVAGAGVEMYPLGYARFSLRGEAAYATASEKFRHYEQLTVPLRRGRTTSIDAEASYADRARPFGANHPAANGIRALAGGSDDRHYLRAQGGSAGLSLRTAESLHASLAYEAARETALEVATDFAIVGSMSGFNQPADPGIDRAVSAAVSYGLLGDDRYQGEIAYRVAGGALGGDFSYQRTEAKLLTRHYLGRQEFFLDARGVITGGDAPVQRLADIGGYDSVRGFPGRMRVGEASVAGRLEYHVPYDLFARTGIPYVKSLHLQFVPWADAGRVWNGNSPEWLTSAGLGLQYYLGPFEQVTHIRLDVAVPMGPDRPADVYAFLGFSRALF